jgi:hypothetical protein
MIVIGRRRLRHSLVQRCGRSVRQCSLSCDSTSQHYLLLLGGLETDTTRPWAESGVSPSTRGTVRPPSPGVSSRYHHTNVETTDRACEERGICYTHSCRRGTVLASTVSLHTRAFLDISATASGVAMPFLSAAPHAIYNAVSSQPHQLTTRLSSWTRIHCQSHVRELLSNTPCYAYQHLAQRDRQLTVRQSRSHIRYGRMMLVAPKRRGNNAFALRPA